MRKIILITFLLSSFVGFAQQENFGRITKESMDTVVFIIDSHSELVKIETGILPIYPDSTLLKDGFEI